LGLNVTIPEYPEYVGALGAALIAATRVKET
jgi:activator of 2-hydroxyglutaryl-CoA dehydratase